jgi:hypothetical protein
MWRRMKYIAGFVGLVALALGFVEVEITFIE